MVTAVRRTRPTIVCSAALAALLLGGCTGLDHAARPTAAATRTPTSSERFASTPEPITGAGVDATSGSGKPGLTVLTTAARYQLPVKATEQVSDGAIIVTNPLDQPIVLESVEPLFLPGDRTDKTDVTATHIIELNPNDPYDTGLGIQRVAPPALLPGERLLDVAGLTLPAATTPARRYVLSVTFRVHDGMAVVVGLLVKFRVGDHEYAQAISHGIALCEGRPAGAADCPPPPHL